MGRKKASANSKARAFRTRDLNIAPHTTTKISDLHSVFSVQLCGLCVSVIKEWVQKAPQRQRDHRGCTEKRADFPYSHEPQLCGIDGATPGNYESSGSGFLVCPGNQEPYRLHEED